MTGRAAAPDLQEELILLADFNVCRLTEANMLTQANRLAAAVGPPHLEFIIPLIMHS